jgi:hypothetical protein
VVAAVATRRASLSALLAAPVLAAGAIAWWDPARTGGPPLCPLRACTGVSCPGCGLTRAAGSLLRGRVHDAVTLQPLIPLLAVEVAVAWAYLALRPVRRVPAVPRAALTSLVWVNAAALLAVWAWRLRTGSIDVVR